MRTALAALALVLATVSAVAQPPPRVRGVVQSVEGNTLVVATEDDGCG
jgi:hypothetical protein